MLSGSLACPKAEPRLDAGVVLVDAGASDAGAADAGLGPCAERCNGVCYRERCVEHQPQCTSNADCDPGQRCSTVGECYAGDCLSHGDCAAEARCAAGRCLPRVEPAAGVSFERVTVPAIHDHHSPLIGPNSDWPPTGVAADMGFGAALFDYDGDLDLDLFLGSQGAGIGGSPACIYRNESVAANLRFVPDETFCQANRTTDLAAGFGTDLDGDGFHELITTGLFQAQLHRFHPERETIDLLGLLDPEDERRRCFASSALTIDLNYDGRLDLILGCSLGPMDDNIGVLDVNYRNIAFLQTPSGDLNVLRREAWNRDLAVLLEAQGVTLALGAADIDDDGLQDLLVSEDRGVMEESIDWLHPGGVYRRCPPGENCRYIAQHYGGQNQGYGAHMGTGLIQLTDRGEFIYVTNEMDNRLVHLREDGFHDIADRMGVELDFVGQFAIFSWGVVVDDFDRDGQDDLFVSNGRIMGFDPAAFSSHFDAIFLQRESGFVLHSADLGISPFTYEDSLTDDRPYASRAALKADLDGDGFLDLIGVGLEGRPRLHREVPNRRAAPPRCTLVPIDRYVPGYGTGHALLPPSGPARRWDSQGQTRSGASPFVLSPWPRGKLRFPSGAEIEFDCLDQAGPLLVEEPQWLDLKRRENTLLVARTEQGPEGPITVFVEPSHQTIQPTLVDGLHQFELPAGTEHFLLQFDGRWMARRWTWSDVQP